MVVVKKFSKGQYLSLNSLTNQEAKDRHYQQTGNIASITATHMLKSQGQALSAAKYAVRHCSYSHSNVPRISLISRIEKKKHIVDTDFLESQGWILLAG